MTSRDRVLTAFAHEEPDRVPVWCGASAEFWTKAKRAMQLDDEALRVRLGDDFRRVTARYAGPVVSLSPGAKFRSIFGVEHHGFGWGQPMSHPLANATAPQIAAYAWPQPDWIDVSQLKQEADAWAGQYAVLGGEWSPFWHDAIDLVGMENLYLMMYDAPDLVDLLLGRIVDFYVAASRRIFDAAASVLDIFFIGNDFGSQAGPLLSPEQFARFMLPQLRRLIELGHAYRLKVQLHCCGGYEPLIPSMIAAGLDGLHALQPCCRGMDLGQLKARYGRQILLNGGIDSQQVLIEGTADQVRQRTRAVLRLMMPGGGYVAGASHDTILEETPLENVLAMFDAAREHGRYR